MGSDLDFRSFAISHAIHIFFASVVTGINNVIRLLCSCNMDFSVMIDDSSKWLIGLHARKNGVKLLVLI
jgi:hypothetical protein